MNLKLLKYNVMVRKIKFRGKDIDTGEWRYGYLSFFYTAGRDKNGFILTDKAQIYSQEALFNYLLKENKLHEKSNIVD